MTSDPPIDASMLAAFIQFNALDAPKIVKENTEWANDAVNEFVRQQPETAWRFICAVVEKDVDKVSFPMLAAGALEDLLSEHGDQFIERVELMSRQNPSFRWLLGGVWRGGMSEDIWELFERIPGKPRW